MEVHLDCIPCFQRQALQAARFVTDDETIHEECLRRVMRALEGADWRSTPPEMSHMVHRVVKDLCNSGDPYLDVKDLYNSLALDVYPDVKRTVEGSDHPLSTAVRLAIGGNEIDFGVGSDFDVGQIVERALDRELSIDDLPELERELSNARSILFLTDNTGEIVFDRLLLETILDRFDVKTIRLAVKGAPVLNDATVEDAREVGLGNLSGAQFVEVGIGEPGTGMERNSEEFSKMMGGSDVVMSKGQGNFEALSGREGIYFLLIAKCPVIAADLGVEVGDRILRRS